MSDLPYNNNPKDECFDNIQEGNSIESKKDPHDDNPKGCSFVDNFDKHSCNCPGFRSSLSSITN